MVIFHFPILTRVAQTGAEYAECVGEQGQNTSGTSWTAYTKTNTDS